MHFEITASQQAVRKNLTSAQRNSSLFSESPRIGGRTLRRGQMLKFDESQFKANEVIIKRLFDAGAIEIVHVVGDKRANIRTHKFDAETVAAEGKVVPPVEDPPALTPVPETKTQPEGALEDERVKTMAVVDEFLAKADAEAKAVLAEATVVSTPAPEPVVESVPAPVVDAAPVVPEVAPVVETVPAVEVAPVSAPVEQGKGKKGKK